MKLGFLYETRPEVLDPDLPVDIYLEMEALEAIQALTFQMENLGHSVQLINVLDEGWRELARVRAGVDLVYNYSVGFGSRSREVYAATMCEYLKIPYTGSEPLTLALASDKYVSKLVARAERVRTPQFRLSRERGDASRLPARWKYCMIKPLYEGSSIGITGPMDTTDSALIQSTIERTKASYQQGVLVEEFIEGYEVTVPVIGTNQPRALSPVGLTLDGELYLGMRTFESRLKVDSASVAWTANLPLSARCVARLREWAVRIHKALGCRDLSRSDFRVTRDGTPFYLETNATPQMTPEGGTFCTAAEAEGLQFRDVLRLILESALERYRVTPRTTLH